MANISLTVNDNQIIADRKQKSLQKLASKLDAETLQKLADLSDNQKAINMLKNPPVPLKIALGIK